MPRRDGTGPLGQGALTGRGFGPCGARTGASWLGRGRGIGRGLGFGRYADPMTLEEERDLLKRRLESIEQGLNKQD